MAVASSSSGQTTRACSIMTLDGYVSRGKAPSNSVPRDHAMLQDFAEYLELRLKCLNMSMLRRIFADFLNEQENTLVPMMQQGCTIITIYPVLRTSVQRRRQAELLLAKPKYHLDTRGCVFLYLQYRTATRNMALLKHLFLEFVCKREASLLAFAERGCQVISVIPFELPQMMPPARPPPPPMMQESPRAVDATTEQRRAVSEPLAKKPTKKRKRKAVPKSTASAASAPADGADQAATLKKARPRLKQTQQKPSAAREDSQIKTKRRRKSASDVSGEYPKPKRGRKRKPEAEKLKTSEGVQENSRKRVKPAVKKSAKRGKPVMSEEMCRSQLELARKMEDFEAQIPWAAAYNNFSPPFDEGKHPALALKFHDFWRKHSRAVWERKFWPPISRKLNLAECNKRNNRQLTAKNAFESLIISAFEELGAQFFVNLDAQTPRYPGWWYRGPVVALFALQQIKGEDTMWNYVMNEALKRFPDCKLPLPLKASNSGAMRIRHKRESVSMWIANHQQTAVILEEMAALKAEVEAGQMAMERTTGELESAGTDSVLL
ncbi:hypothetical protein JG688_00008055 [Phytophthora aleatoria]|uniref:Uncharacterized protein n=1 Tax=Phytophthora aleatoria TaxID=2496075 RepID=A0A8J5IIM4_9STRA|nr:hypothetical protein JG688_00008055 [Phytophthora aleatoria]